MTTMIDTNDFSDILEMVKERVEKWGEELHNEGWRGNIGLLLEGETGWSEWVSPHVGGGIDLEKGEPHSPMRYDAEEAYLYGTDDENYPVNQINEILCQYTGTRPYWYHLSLRIHPEDGVRLAVVG